MKLIFKIYKKVRELKKEEAKLKTSILELRKQIEDEKIDYWKAITLLHKQMGVNK